MTDRTAQPRRGTPCGCRTMATKGDRKGRPYRCVPRMRPMTDRTGDPVGAPLAGAPDDTTGKGL
jgi:hypothetical protein